MMHFNWKSLYFFAVLYLFVGAVWMFFADALFAALFPAYVNGFFLTRPILEVIKYSVFILVSAGVFLILWNRAARARASIEHSLADERELKAKLLSTPDTLILILDPLGRILQFNRASEDVLGYTFAEVKDKYTWDVFVATSESENERAAFEKILVGRAATTRESIWQTKQKRPRVIKWNSEQLSNFKGELQYVIQTGVDVTDALELRGELQENEARLFLLNESVSDLALIVDANGIIQETNPALLNLLGYNSADWKGTYLAQHIHPSESATLLDALTNTNAAPSQPLRFRFSDHNHEWHCFEISLRHVPDSLNLLLTARDLTPLLDAQVQVEQQGRRLQILTEASNAFAEMTLDYPAVIETAAERIGKWLGDACIIHILLPDQKRLEPVGLYHSEADALDQLRDMFNAPHHADELLSGRALRSGQSFLLDEASTDAQDGSADTWHALLHFRVQSALVAPLQVHGRALGTVEVWRVSPHPPFTLEDLALLEDLAHRTALAFSNARLLDQSEHRLNRLQALRNIDMAITSSLDLRVTLSVFLDQVTTHLGVDAASLLLLNSHLQILEYAAGRGFRTPSLQHTHLRVGEGHAGRVALERRILTVSELDQSYSEFHRAPLFKDEEFVSYCAVPLVAKGHLKGVMELFHRASLDFNPDWMEFVESLATEAAIAMENGALFDDLQRSNVELILAYDRTLEGWVKALDLRDRETEGHTLRVSEMTLRLARAMNISDLELMHFRRGALLHDIGKIGVPDAILSKPGPLTPEEREIMQRHPTYAYEMLSPIAFLRPALDIPYCHHERWDGTGYPRGLREEHIPLAARIFAVADVWDALSSDRPYHLAWAPDKVREYVRAQSGSHFDPDVVRVIMEIGMDSPLRRGDIGR